MSYLEERKTKNDFYMTSVTFTVLSAEPIPDAMEVDTIIYECNEGDYVLHSVPEFNVTQLNRTEISLALIEAGSDPSFFLGEDEEDE